MVRMEKEEQVNHHEILFRLLDERKICQELENEYIKQVKKFYGNAIDTVHVTFKNGKMYLSFECWEEIPPKMMLDFCNEFGYLSPTCEFHDLSRRSSDDNGIKIILRKYTFIKLLR